MFKVYSSFVLVMVCGACGSTFSVAEGSGGSGSGQAGDASGGQTSTAGSSSGGDAGEVGMAGASSSGDGGAPAGGSGASAGNGGAGNGGVGNGGAAGSSTGNNCATLKQDYQAALEKARVCDQGSTQQCSASSTIAPLSCGCPVLVNAKSEYTAAAKKARQAFLDAKCVDGVLCSAIACAPITDAGCAPAAATGSSYVCSAITAIAN